MKPFVVPPKDAVKQFFGNQLRKAMEEKGWQLKDIEAQTGFKGNKVNQWMNGVHAPDFSTLVVLARLFKKSVDWFLLEEADQLEDVETHPNVARVVVDPTQYQKARDELIAETQEELWIVHRIGSMFNTSHAGNVQALDKLMKERDIRLRVMLTDPGVSENEPAGAENWEARYRANSALKVVALARSTSPGNIVTAGNDIRSAIINFDTWINEPGERILPNRAKSKILLIPYAIASIIFMSDPETDEGKVLAVTAAFRSNVMAAPHVQVEKSKERAVFNWYYEDCRKMWKVFDRN